VTPVAARSHAACAHPLGGFHAPYRCGVRFRVLGPVELVDPDGSPEPIGSPNQRRILAMLLSRVGEVVTIDTMVDALWANEPPRSAVATLRTYVSRLRSFLGDDLATRGSGYALVAEATEVDAGRFETLVRDAAAAEPGRALALLDEALRLWHGPAFGDHADVECIAPEARRLEELRRAAAEARVDTLLAAGGVDEAVADAEALVTSEPLREGAWAGLIRSLAAQGRTADALRAFQRASEALADAGLEPSSVLRDAERAVLAGDVAVQPVRERSVPRVPTSSLVGRDHDREALLALLAEARVVTLVGPGGVGKTRLALEVARAGAERHTLGAKVAELAPLPDGTGVADTVIHALGLTADAQPAADALERAGALDVLLVLDNAEHLVDSVAGVVERIVAGGNAIRIVVTSRERLGVDGEHVRPVAPLPTDEAGSPARRLLVQRAAAAAPDLTVDVDDDLVARIVDRLDGLPLAIEMAAAQLPTTSLAELADALDDRLADLRSPRRHAPERHRTLGAVLEWSEARLDDRQRATLAGLSVFAGPVAADDIVGVLGETDVVDVVRSLADCSLVLVERTGPTTRYSLLQTVRDFATERAAVSGLGPDLARRHAERFLAVAREADASLRTSAERMGFERIESSFAELRAAHQWAREHDLPMAGALSAALHLYAYSRLVDEPLRWAQMIADELADDDPHLPIVLASAALRRINRGELAVGRALTQRAVAIARTDAAVMPALEALADACVYAGRLDETIAADEELIRRAEAAGDPNYWAVAHASVAMARSYGGQPAALPTETMGDTGPTGRAWLLYARGELLGDRDPDAALASYDETIALAREVDSRFVEGVALVSSCALQARVGDVSRAFGQFADAIHHWIELGDHTHQLTTLRNLAVLLQRAGAADAAAELLGALGRDESTYGEEAERLAAARAWAVRELGEEEFKTRAEAGRSRDVPATAAWALDLIAGLLD
jgi:predicted ATPase/DNA-binding SARP family transcriptional activator